MRTIVPLPQIQSPHRMTPKSSPSTHDGEPEEPQMVSEALEDAALAEDAVIQEEEEAEEAESAEDDSVIDIDASVEGSTEQEKASRGVPLTLQAASQPLHYGQSTVAPDTLPITPRHTEKTGMKRPAPAVSQGALNDDRTSPGEAQELPCTSLINEGGYPSSRPSAPPASSEYMGSTLRRQEA